MGTGKTSWAIQEMKANPEESYIFCTPFLKEIERIQKECESSRKFCDPMQINGRKIDGFNYLLMNGRDIAVTHATFANANDDTLEYLKQGNYTLILDEVLDILVPFNDVATKKINKADIRFLLDEELISIDAYGHVKWMKAPYPGASYSDVENLAKAGNLFYLDETMLVWQFPPHIFKLFKHVYVLTYLFEGSYLKPYFEYHGIEYDLSSLGTSEDGRYMLIPYTTYIQERANYKKLIHILDNQKMNNYKASSLCSTWYKNANKEQLNRLQKNLFNYFHNITKAKAPDIMWTCKKAYQKDLTGKGYSATRRITSEEKLLPAEELKDVRDRIRCHLPCNMRASNDYKDRSVLAYCVNFFPNPYVKNYFKNKNKTDGINIKVDEDRIALSFMLQWIWRSCIRDGKPIQIYIPSTRMRTLLIDWLDVKI